MGHCNTTVKELERAINLLEQRKIWKEAVLMVVQTQDKMGRVKIPPLGEVYQKIGREMVDKETVELEQEEGVEKVMEVVAPQEILVPEELNAWRPFSMPHRTVRNMCNEEELVFKNIALGLTVMMKTSKHHR